MNPPDFGRVVRGLELLVAGCAARLAVAGIPARAMFSLRLRLGAG